ncbi:MAG: response regulator [Candidatus Omnitrophota bacterium]
MEKKKILIVDDEPEIRNLLKVFFEKRDYNAVAEENGVLALKIMGQQQFDCLISDINMPLMNGIDFSQQARDMCPDLVIILLTGYGSLETAQKAIKTGISDYLTKPVDPEQLRVSVERGLKFMEERRKDVSYYRELTKSLEEDRMKLDSLKDDLIGLINHELRTPISVISESFNVLKDTVIIPEDTKFTNLTEEEKKRTIEIFNKGHRRLKDIIGDLSYYLDLNKGVELKTSEVNLKDFLLANFDGFNNLILGKNAVLKSEFHDGGLKVRIDKDRFIDVLSRIINNAVGHNSEGVEITLRLNPGKSIVETGAEKKLVRIEISDNGKGITKEVMERIFTIFNVSDIMQHSRGLGLGLVICKKVIDLHQGNITVDSQEGKSTTVTIKLPVIGE